MEHSTSRSRFTLLRPRRCRRRRRSSSISPACTRAPASRSRTSSPSSMPRTGRIVHETPMPNVGDELHHFGWNRCSSACHGPDRSHLIVPGFRSSRIHVVNVADDPRRPRIEKVIERDELVRATGLTRPHTVHCMPGENIVISMLGDADGNGACGFAVLDARTFEVKGRWENGGARRAAQLRLLVPAAPERAGLVGVRRAQRLRVAASTSTTSPPAATAAACTSGTWPSAASSRRSSSARPGWSRWRCAGCTIPTPTRASSAPRCRARCGTSTATTAPTAPSR